MIKLKNYVSTIVETQPTVKVIGKADPLSYDKTLTRSR